MPQPYTLLFLQNHTWVRAHQEPPNNETPTYSIHPVKQVCFQLGITKRNLVEAFRFWGLDDHPERYFHQIGTAKTTRGAERKVYLQIDYRPNVLYQDGSVHIAQQWGENGGEPRTVYERGHYLFSLETVIMGHPFKIEADQE